MIPVELKQWLFILPNGRQHVVAAKKKTKARGKLARRLFGKSGRGTLPDGVKCREVK